MNISNKIIMFQMAVVDMDVSKDFYKDKLGFELTKDIKRHGNRWVL